MNTSFERFSNLSSRCEFASSVTITSLRPNCLLTLLLVLKNTLILKSSVIPGMHMLKKQGARFLRRLECSVIKLTSRLISAEETKVFGDDLNTETTV